MLRASLVVIAIAFTLVPAEAKSHPPKHRVSMKKPPVANKFNKHQKPPVAKWGNTGR